MSRNLSVSRSNALEPQRVMSLLFDDSVPSAVSVGISSERKAPLSSSKKLTVLSRLKVPMFCNYMAAAVYDLTVFRWLCRGKLLPSASARAFGSRPEILAVMQGVV